MPLTYSLELSGPVEVNTQQAFVDILDKDVIEPLTTFKVR